MRGFTFFIVIIVILIASCNGDAPKSGQDILSPVEDTTTAIPVPVEQIYTVEVIKGENGWGYNILLNGKPFIRQPNIPSVPGNKGFDSEEKAQKVADFILNKIQNGMMPPSTNKEELESLGVL